MIDPKCVVLTLFLLVLVPVAGLSGVQAPDAPVFVAAGPTGEVLRVDTVSGTVSTLFAAKGGFKPESLTLAGDGNFYICDASNSEIFRLSGDGSTIETVYDRNSAVSPDNPEQPAGCTVRGADLFFLSRAGKKSSETGIWVISDLVGSSAPFNPPQAVQFQDFNSGRGEGLAAGPDSLLYFTVADQVFRTTADLSDAAAFADLNGRGFGLAPNGFGEVFVALRDQAVVEFFDSEGARCDFAHLDGDLPQDVVTDATGNLWVTASEQSSGRRGSVWFVPAARDAGGTPIPFCDPGAGTPQPVLAADGLAAALGGGLGPTQSEPVTLSLTNDGDKTDTANLCSILFNLQAEDVDPTCLVDVSCRLVTQAEFEARTDNQFAGTVCADIPAAQGHCVEIRSDDQRLSTGQFAQCISDITARKQFVTLNQFTSPGLLYSPGALDAFPEDNFFDENILVEFLGTIPDAPLDPRMSGSRIDWGSGVIAVDGAPNRDPVAAAVAVPSSLACDAPDTATVLLDGAASDPDAGIILADGTILDGVASTTWSGPGGFSASTEDVTITGGQLSPGDNTFTFEVSDQRGGMDSATVTVSLVDDGAPTIGSVTPSPAMLWPPDHKLVPVTLAIAGVTDACSTSSCRIVSVRSTDPQEGTGDGDASPDWIFDPGSVAVGSDGTATLSLQLRSERSEGSDSVDDTRVYTIEVACTDAAGNETVTTTTVTVESDQGGDD